MSRAFVILPARNASGADLCGLHHEFAAELAEFFEPPHVVPLLETWWDVETGQPHRFPAVRFDVEADWTGRAPGKLERLAARYCGKAGLDAVTVVHANGESVMVCPAEPAPFLSKKQREALEADAA